MLDWQGSEGAPPAPDSEKLVAALWQINRLRRSLAVLSMTWFSRLQVSCQCMFQSSTKLSGLGMTCGASMAVSSSSCLGP